MPSAPSSSARLASLVLIGAVMPALFGALDVWLLATWRLFPLMALLVAQIGLAGPLCAHYIQPRWLLWLIYAWFWLMMDLMLVALATLDPFEFESISPNTLPAGILSSQLGLVIVWAALGRTRWTIRWPAALLLCVAILIPILSHHSPPTELLILISLQSAILLAVTASLACRGFRLVRIDPTGQLSLVTSPDHLPSQRSASQFQLRDLLIWTTALAIALAVARVINYWGSSFAAWQYILSIAATGRTKLFLLGSPTAAILTAVVLLVALWAALGQGSTRLRWSLLLLIVGAVSVGHGLHDYYQKSWTPRWSPLIMLLLDRDYFWSLEAPLLIWHWLTGGMLFAALLIVRALGYRLCRIHTTAPNP